jgi:hypothetical protein
MMHRAKAAPAGAGLTKALIQQTAGRPHLQSVALEHVEHGATHGRDEGIDTCEVKEEEPTLDGGLFDLGGGDHGRER